MDAPRKRSPRKHTSVLRLLAVGALFLATVLPWAVPAGASAQVAAQEDPGSHKPVHRPAVTANHGLVTSGNNLASMSGLRMLLNGGNAADAAVATFGEATTRGRTLDSGSRDPRGHRSRNSYRDLGQVSGEL